MTTKYAIQVKGLRKNYNGFTAVDNLDFAVREGEIFSLLGPNGAGKSTTIAMLSCLLPPSGGEAGLAGRSITRAPREVHRRGFALALFVERVWVT